MRRAIGVMFLTVTFLLGTHMAEARARRGSSSEATVHFSGGSVAAGIGYSWGSGTLHYRGKSYPIKVDGLSVGDVGATSVNAEGTVYHLSKLEDFPGTYVAAAAGAAAGGGGSISEMKNENGVVIKARSTTTGLKLKLGVDGVKISMTQ
jgi:hypothetical protein